MTYQQALFEACGFLKHPEELLSRSMEFQTSATEIQLNSEAKGARIDDLLYRIIYEKKCHESCELMVMQVDGAMSPQIHYQEGSTGRESVRQPKEYKECNLVIVEKHNGKQRIDRGIGAQYDPR